METHILNSVLFSLDLSIVYMGEESVSEKIQKIKHIYTETNIGEIPKGFSEM